MATEEDRNAAIEKEATARVDARFVAPEAFDPNNPEDAEDIAWFKGVDILSEKGRVRIEWDERDGRGGGFDSKFFQQLIADQQRDNEEKRKREEASGQTPECRAWIGDVTKRVERVNSTDALYKYLTDQQRNISRLRFRIEEHRSLPLWAELMPLGAEMDQMARRLQVLTSLSLKVLNPLVQFEKNLVSQVPLRKDTTPASASELHRLQKEETELKTEITNAVKVLDSAVNSVQTTCVQRANPWMQKDGTTFGEHKEAQLLAALKVRAESKAGAALLNDWKAKSAATGVKSAAATYSPCELLLLAYMTYPYMNETPEQRSVRKEREQELADEAAEKEEFEAYMRNRFPAAHVDALMEALKPNSAAKQIFAHCVAAAQAASAPQTLQQKEINELHAKVEEALAEFTEQLEKIQTMNSNTDILVNASEAVLKQIPNKKKELQLHKSVREKAVIPVREVIERLDKAVQAKSANEVLAIQTQADKELASAATQLKNPAVESALEYHESRRNALFSIRMDFEIEKGPERADQNRQRFVQLQESIRDVSDRVTRHLDDLKAGRPPQQLIKCPASEVTVDGKALCVKPDCKFPESVLLKITKTCKCKLTMEFLTFRRGASAPLAKDHVRFNKAILRDWENHKYKCAVAAAATK